MDSVTNNTANLNTVTSQSAATNQTPVVPKTADEIVKEHKAAVMANRQDQVTISPRAEKIKMLNEEFFPSGPKSVQITPAFIQRLNEYELISDADAQKFLNQLDKAPSNTTNTLGEISNFIEIFKGELEKEEANHPLLDRLDEANNIILDMAKGQSSYSKDDIGAVINALNAFSDDYPDHPLTEEQQASLQEVQDILSIIQRFNSGKPSGEAAQQYAAVFSQGN